MQMRVGCTCRAARPEDDVTHPSRPISSTVPTSTEEAVDVVRETLSQTAQSEERASPRKPKVRTVVRSENVESFDVWCFRAKRIKM
jgi:hypothetical protein